MKTELHNSIKSQHGILALDVPDCVLAREQVAGGAAAAGDDAALPRAEADVARPRQHQRRGVVQTPHKLAAKDAQVGTEMLFSLTSTRT